MFTHFDAQLACSRSQSNLVGVGKSNMEIVNTYLICILPGNETAATINVSGFTLLAFTDDPETPRAEVKRPPITCTPAESIVALHLGITSSGGTRTQEHKQRSSRTTSKSLPALCITMLSFPKHSTSIDLMSPTYRVPLPSGGGLHPNIKIGSSVTSQVAQEPTSTLDHHQSLKHIQ